MPKSAAVALKITSVGNSEVGKSCLIKRYCEGRFVKRYISTIGVDYGVKKLTVKDVPVSINFFDLSGNEIAATNSNGNVELVPNGSGKVIVVDDSVTIETSKTPSTSVGADGDTAGMIAWDASYIYVCTAAYDGSTNIWKRASIGGTW